jgi:hypothetical protein
MKVMADKEVTDKRAVEEAMVKEAEDKEAADKRVAEEATTKEVAVGAGRHQECGGAKRLHPTSQTTLQGHLETLVCLFFLYSIFFIS